MILARIILTLFMMLLEVMICITYCQFNLSLLILNFIKTFKHLCIIFLYYRLLHSCLPQHCTSLRISILTIVVSCIIIVMKYHITNNVRRNTIPTEPNHHNECKTMSIILLTCHWSFTVLLDR